MDVSLSSSLSWSSSSKQELISVWLGSVDITLSMTTRPVRKQHVSLLEDTTDAKDEQLSLPTNHKTVVIVNWSGNFIIFSLRRCHWLTMMWIMNAARTIKKIHSRPVTLAPPKATCRLQIHHSVTHLTSVVPRECLSSLHFNFNHSTGSNCCRR